MNMPNLHRIYLTEVHMDVECDAFYPEFDKEDFNIVRLVNVNMHTAGDVLFDVLPLLPHPSPANNVGKRNINWWL
jgi:hypothetical protein